MSSRRHVHGCRPALAAPLSVGVMMEQGEINMMSLREIKIEETAVCVMCNHEWTTENEVEKYCGKCKSHIVIIQDEVYYSQGW